MACALPPRGVGAGSGLPCVVRGWHAGEPEVCCPPLVDLPPRLSQEFAAPPVPALVSGRLRLSQNFAAPPVACTSQRALAAEPEFCCPARGRH